MLFVINILFHVIESKYKYNSLINIYFGRGYRPKRTDFITITRIIFLFITL